MKEWKVSYSVCYMDGRVEEREETVMADDIIKALTIAETQIRIPLELDPRIMDAVIWDVGIIGDDVF